MKQITGSIDSVPITINVPETLTEYKEGARASGGQLRPDEGYLFDFGQRISIQMENSDVQHDLAVLYFFDVKRYGVVQKVNVMPANSTKSTSSQGLYNIALELRQDFCQANRIGSGSILILNEDLK